MIIAGFLFVIGGIAALYFLKLSGFFLSAAVDINDDRNSQFSDFITEYRGDEAQIQAWEVASQRYDDSVRERGQNYAWKHYHNRHTILANKRIRKLIKSNISTVINTCDDTRRKELRRLYRSL